MANFIGWMLYDLFSILRECNLNIIIKVLALSFGAPKVVAFLGGKYKF